MSSDLRKQIRSRLNLLETDELINIWHTNDHVAWTDLAFDVIQEILIERIGEPPSQDKLVANDIPTDLDLEVGDNENNDNNHENEPDFYEPNEVLWLEKWLNRAALASIGATILVNLVSLPNMRNIILTFNMVNLQWEALSWVIAIIIFVVVVAIESTIYYEALKTMGVVLRILMEMEFNSRGFN